MFLLFKILAKHLFLNTMDEPKWTIIAGIAWWWLIHDSTGFFFFFFISGAYVRYFNKSDAFWCQNNLTESSFTDENVIWRIKHVEMKFIVWMNVNNGRHQLKNTKHLFLFPNTVESKNFVKTFFFGHDKRTKKWLSHQCTKQDFILFKMRRKKH